MRRRCSSAVRPVKATFMVNPIGAATIERFWDEDTAGGSLPFVMPDPVNHGGPLSAGGAIVTVGGKPLTVSA